MKIAYATNIDPVEWEKIPDEQRKEIVWVEMLAKIQDQWWDTRGENVKVAILDTGVDRKHKSLKGAIKTGINFTTEGSKSDYKDLNGHGTHCAGIIAGRRPYGDKESFRGMAPMVDLYIAKVLNKKGEGSHKWVAEGIKWAIQQKVDIITMSFSSNRSSAMLYEAVHLALKENICVICAAGNAGSLAQNAIGYPGRYGGVITIAAHDKYGRPSLFSSTGGELDFMAPGAEIWSTSIEGKFACLSGTSMATPFVAGLSALIIAKHKEGGKNRTPIDNNEDLKSHLMRMAAHPGYHDHQTGYGPLLPFRFVSSDLPTEGLPDLKATVVYGRPDREDRFEYDDRVDLCEVKESSYWDRLQNSYSGRIWEHDYYGDIQDQVLAFAKAIPIVVHRSLLKKKGDEWELKTIPLEKNLKNYVRNHVPHAHISKNFRFLSQPSVRGFTAFLTQPKVLLTCIHGMTDDKVKDYVAVFGFQMTDTKKCVTTFARDRVYPLKRIVHRSNPGNPNEDWCFVELGKNVAYKVPCEEAGNKDKEKLITVKPISLKPGKWKSFDPDKRIPVYMLGYPLGLPLKFAPDGEVIEQITREAYRTDLDAFRGNSGSPVFHATKHKAIGLLFAGREDLSFDPQTATFSESIIMENAESLALEKIHPLHLPMQQLKSHLKTL